jgi:DnaJ like chaperone protein
VSDSDVTAPGNARSPAVSIWQRVREALARLAPREGLLQLFERLRTPPERSVGFAIATIALGAKIAKADGLVTRGEVAAFREVFLIPEGEERNAARVYDLARSDVAGFEDYARQVRRMFGRGAPQLADLLEGLFHVAVADGDYHPGENQFLHRVAGIFEVSDRDFQRIRAEFVEDAECHPLDVLGPVARRDLGGGPRRLEGAGARHPPRPSGGARPARGGGPHGREAPGRREPRLGAAPGGDGVRLPA